MIYGLLRYYNDELTSWKRAVEFHREESGELVRQITVMLDQQLNSPSNEKESSSFIDQFMVQLQEFDHINNQVTSQKQRLGRIASVNNVVEQTICHQQDLLRARMQSLERNFVRTKYTCAIFLSSFLNDQLLPAIKAKVLN